MVQLRNNLKRNKMATKKKADSYTSYAMYGKKMKSGGKTSFGMLSVKAGVDKNPNPTAADRIAGAKMKSGKKMRGGGTVGKSLGTYGKQIGKNYSGKAKSGMKMGKCRGGC